MIILGIETSCDETSAALVRNGKEVLSNIVASQEELHKKFEGVIPEIACRAHVKAITPVVQEAFEKSGLSLASVDAVAVSNQPGLAGSLLIGDSIALKYLNP